MKKRDKRTEGRERKGKRKIGKKAKSYDKETERRDKQ